MFCPFCFWWRELVFRLFGVFFWGGGGEGVFIRGFFFLGGGEGVFASAFHLSPWLCPFNAGCSPPPMPSSFVLVFRIVLLFCLIKIQIATDSCRFWAFNNINLIYLQHMLPLLVPLPPPPPPPPPTPYTHAPSATHPSHFCCFSYSCLHLVCMCVFFVRGVRGGEGGGGWVNGIIFFFKKLAQYSFCLLLQVPDSALRECRNYTDTSDKDFIDPKADKTTNINAKA